MNADTQPSSNNIPLRSQQRAPGRFRRARVLLAALLATMVAAAACPWPINAVQQNPGQGTATTRVEGVLQAKGPGKWQVGKLEVLLDDTIRRDAERAAKLSLAPGSSSGANRAAPARCVLTTSRWIARQASRAQPFNSPGFCASKRAPCGWSSNTLIEITPDTVISGQPVVGALVWVVALQQGNALRALAAEVLAPDPNDPALRV